MGLDRGSRETSERGRAGRTTDDVAPTAGKRTLTSELSPGVPGQAPSPGVPAVAPDGVTGSADQLPQLDQMQRSFGADDVGHIQADTNAAATVVQRKPKDEAKDPAACNIPFPRVEYNTPTGKICRRFDGTQSYSNVTKAQLAAAGYRFWITDGGFDKWVKIDGSSELWVQLPKTNAATSAKAIGQLRSVVATRKAQLDELETLARLMDNSDPEVASEARSEWQERMAEFPGFDDDYALVPKLRDQVDAEHRKEFEDSVKALMEQRDRYDPQSTYP
jgi:hypothetical protein